jgi:secondary thiamine-phosphate synthase enzyme
MAHRIDVRSSEREQLIDITGAVRDLLRGLAPPAGDAVLHLWSMHTTCALTVNEGFDPDVAGDIVHFMKKLVPRESGFHHAEGNSDSHLKVAFFGPGLSLLVEDGELVLGRWQRVFLCEWDGPRTRTLAAVLR